MARIVNQQVVAVNSLMSPSTALQYVKQFNPSQLERERITGGGCQGLAGDLDGCLAFQPVRLKAMGLPVFPLLPPLEQVRRHVCQTAEAAFAAHPEAAGRLLGDAARF